MSRFTTFYYLVADIGSWTVGGVTLVLCRRGVGVHRSRLLAFGACSLLTMGTLAVPFLPNGWPLRCVLLLVAFGGWVCSRRTLPCLRNSPRLIREKCRARWVPAHTSSWP